MIEKNLKPEQYYIDLYDQGTVERCRRMEKPSDNPTPMPNEDKMTEREKAAVEKCAKEMILYFEKGERYLNKRKTIQDWMDKDRKRDELYELAEAPAGIRCLTCRNLLKPTFKDLWTELDKPDRVLFMYDCPNQCLPRRAFFSDGQEWRTKPDLCPKCQSGFKHEQTDTGEKLITTYTCPSCGFIKKDEYVWRKKEEEEFDPDFAKDRDRFCLTDEEGRKYEDSKWKMKEMAKFAEEWKEEEKRRAEKLKENPKGFHLDGRGYTCFICGDSTHEGDNWYDEYGIKCLVCQKAIDEGEIPASLAKDKESWYSKYDLESAFGIKGPTLRSWVKKGILKPRVISYYGKGSHYDLFMIEDNKDTLPPKDLVKSEMVNETGEDGSVSSRSEPWYRFVDPYEHLKGYKILDHLVFTEKKEDNKKS